MDCIPGHREDGLDELEGYCYEESLGLGVSVTIRSSKVASLAGASCVGCMWTAVPVSVWMLGDE